MKKWASLLLAAVMVLMLFACGGTSETDAGTTEITASDAEMRASEATAAKAVETHEYYTEYPFIEKVDSVLPNATYLGEDDGTKKYSLGSSSDQAEANLRVYWAYVSGLSGVTVEEKGNGLFSITYNGDMIGAFGIYQDGGSYALGLSFF